MTGQDIAVLALLQLAILTAAALTAWTCYVAGYARGYQAADVFGAWKRSLQRLAKQLQVQLASFEPPRLRIPDRDQDQVDAMRMAFRQHAAFYVPPPRAVMKVTDTTT